MELSEIAPFAPSDDEASSQLAVYPRPDLLFSLRRAGQRRLGQAEAVLDLLYSDMSADNGGHSVDCWIEVVAGARALLKQGREFERAADKKDGRKGAAL